MIESACTAGGDLRDIATGAGIVVGECKHARTSFTCGTEGWTREEAASQAASGAATDVAAAAAGRSLRMSYANVWTPRETRLLFTRRKTGDAKGGAKRPAARAAGRSRSPAAGGKKSAADATTAVAKKKTDQAVAAASAAAAAPRNFKLRLAASLSQLHIDLCAEAEQAERAEKDAHASFDRRLGAALAKQVSAPRLTSQSAWHVCILS